MPPLSSQLFPPDAATAWSERRIRARLFECPASWTQLVHELCTDDPDCTEGLTQKIFDALSDTVGLSSKAIWRIVWSTGLIPALTELIDAKFLCGYTQEQLTAVEGSFKAERIHSLLKLFFASAERIIEDGRKERVKELARILDHTIVPVYVKLWDTRDLFLMHESMPNLGSLQDILCTLGRLTVEELQEHRVFHLVQSRILHVFLLVWLHGDDSYDRMEALSNLDLLNKPPHPWTTGENDTDSWEAFFQTALDGCTSDKYIMEAILQDLSYEEVTNWGMLCILNFLWVRRESWPWDTSMASWEPRLATRCLGAARRQLCMGETSDNSSTFLNISFAVLKILTQNATLSRRHCYGLLELFSRTITLLLEEDHKFKPDTLTTFAESILAHLTARPSPSGTKPRTAAQQQHAHTAWQTVSDVLVARHLASRDAAWRRFAQTWRALGRAVPAVQGAGVQSACARLRHCAWAQCLCSRHRALHRMRMCGGCERVVYCGAACQRRDWEEGGHREWCRRVAG